MTNRGALELKRKLARKKLNQRDLALKTHIDEGTMSRIIRGKRRPGLADALALKAVLKIDPALWLQDVPNEAA